MSATRHSPSTRSFDGRRIIDYFSIDYFTFIIILFEKWFYDENSLRDELVAGKVQMCNNYGMIINKAFSFQFPLINNEIRSI